jgi:O-methyltransferase
MKDRELVRTAYKLILGREPESEQVLDREFSNIFSLRSDFLNSEEFKSKYLLLSQMGTPWEKFKIIFQYADFVRHMSLELISHEIYQNNIKGNVAELGVYRGDFAQFINLVFPDRKLYLFDTFEGFNPKDKEYEKSKNRHVPEDYHKETSIELVMSKMKYRENCIIKKGYFPETTDGLEDTFSFVNIDVDFEVPIYNGLCWFYPRFEKSGYIFVHNYTDSLWTGAKVGVKKFTEEYEISYFPLSDTGGSAVFIK